MKIKMGVILVMAVGLYFSVGCVDRKPNVSSPAHAASNGGNSGSDLSGSVAAIPSAAEEIAGDDVSEFAKKIACVVQVRGQSAEPMKLVYDTTMKVFNLTFMVAEDDDGTPKLEVLKTAADLAATFELLVAKEVQLGIISPSVMRYAPSTLQKVYANQKMRAAGRFILTAEARIYSYNGANGDTVRLLYRDLEHTDELKDPNKQIELTVNDDLRMVVQVPAMGRQGAGTAEVEMSCTIAK
jgi:hypothetical protein